MGRNHRISDWNPEDAAAWVLAAALTWMRYVRRPSAPEMVHIADHARL